MSGDVFDTLARVQVEARGDATTGYFGGPQATEDFTWLLDHEPGRRIAYYLIVGSGFYGMPYKGNQSDAFNAGAAAVGRMVHLLCSKANQEAFIVMNQAHMNYQRAALARIDAANKAAEETEDD